MNKSVILLFLLVFGVASTGQTFAQPSVQSMSRENQKVVNSDEGHRLTKKQKQWVHENRPESREKQAIPLTKCEKGGEWPTCLNSQKPKNSPFPKDKL